MEKGLSVFELAPYKIYVAKVNGEYVSRKFSIINGELKTQLKGASSFAPCEWFPELNANIQFFETELKPVSNKVSFFDKIPFVKLIKKMIYGDSVSLVSLKNGIKYRSNHPDIPGTCYISDNKIMDGQTNEPLTLKRLSLKTRFFKV